MISLGLGLGIPRYRGGGAFSPGEYNPSLWLMSTAGTFQTVGGAASIADADPVGQWLDQSSNNRHVTQATASKRPSFRTNVKNGLPAVRWDGIDDVLQGTGAIFNGAGGTVYIVIKGPNPLGAQNMYLDMGVDGATSRRIMSFAANASTMTLVRDGGGGTASITGLVAGGWQLAVGVYDGAASYIQVNGTNGATASLSAVANANGNPFGIGSRFTGDAAFLTGDIGELVIFPVAHTPAQIVVMRNYLNARWGVF